MTAYFPWFLFDFEEDDPFRNPPEKKYPISPPVHYGFDVIRGYRGLFKPGTPQHAEVASRRLGAPVAASPNRTEKASRPQRGKASLAASERVGGRPSSAHGRRKQTSVSARGKCPKGHYWSYKEKKCVSSKFR